MEHPAGLELVLLYDEMNRIERGWTETARRFERLGFSSKTSGRSINAAVFSMFLSRWREKSEEKRERYLRRWAVHPSGCLLIATMLKEGRGTPDIANALNNGDFVPMTEGGDELITPSAIGKYVRTNIGSLRKDRDKVIRYFERKAAFVTEEMREAAFHTNNWKPGLTRAAITFWDERVGRYTAREVTAKEYVELYGPEDDPESSKLEWRRKGKKKPGGYPTIEEARAT